MTIEKERMLENFVKACFLPAIGVAVLVIWSLKNNPPAQTKLADAPANYKAKPDEEVKISIDYTKMPEKVAKKAQAWANGGAPPAAFATIHDRKITEVYLAADSWKRMKKGLPDAEFRTAMHLVAEKYIGKMKTENNLADLKEEMEWAIQYHFTK